MEQALTYFFPGECYDKVIRNFNFFDVECLSFAFSRFLSFSILVGAVGVKLPQILKIGRSKSIEGLSYMSFFFELAAVTITSGYNYSKRFPFSTWGESFFIAIQLFIIICLMFTMDSKLPFLGIFVAVYSVICYGFYTERVPIEVLEKLQGSTIVLMIISKMIHVLTTYQNGSTGQQAFLTNFLNWIGSLGRVFTTLKETMDLLMLTSFSVAFGLNTLIVFQFLWYWNVPSKADVDAKKKA